MRRDESGRGSWTRRGLPAASGAVVAGTVDLFRLVDPRIVRPVVGSDYRRLLVGCPLAASALMVGADGDARLGLPLVLGSAGQVPVGIVTGPIGGPCVLCLMRRRDEFSESRWTRATPHAMRRRERTTRTTGKKSRPGRERPTGPHGR